MSDQQPGADAPVSLVAPEVTVAAPNPTLDPLLNSGNECLARGDMTCAYEKFQAAYTKSQDPFARAALYDYYLLNGDLWQSNGKLDSARGSYADAVRLDPANPLATDRLSNLEGYVAVEFFDTFETFGEPGMYEARDGGATVHQVTEGVLALTSTMDEFQTNRYFHHTPQSPNYAIDVTVKSTGPTTGLGIILANDPSEAAYRFAVDPAAQEWWIAYHNADGSWTDMIVPTSYAGMGLGPIDRLTVEVRNGTPKFFANGLELTAAFDLSWMQIPRTGDPGVSIDTSVADPWAPISATFDSFGIYAL